MKRAKVGTIQLDCEPMNAEGNLQLALNLIRLCKRSGAELVVLPHMFATGYNVFLNPARVAEEISGTTVTFLKMVAQKMKISVVAGFVEKCEGLYYDTSVVVDPAGEIIGSYRRTSLWEDEAAEIVRGGDLCVVDTPIGRAGILVSRDFTIPEIARTLAFEGAELLLVSSAMEDHASWEVFVRARAMENACFIVAANRIGVEGELSYCGHSMIVDPNGLVLSDSESRQEAAVTELNPKALEAARADDWQLIELMESFGLERGEYLYEPISCGSKISEPAKGSSGRKGRKAAPRAKKGK